MSLDVTLYKDGYSLGDKREFNEFELRHLAVNFAISCGKGSTQSFEDWFSGISSDWLIIANVENPDFYESDYKKELYSANITHNLGKMAKEANIYTALWRPEEMGAKIASDLIETLTVGLSDLKSRPKYFKQFNSSNGWGLYKHFVPFVEKYLEACKENTNALISISR